MTIAAHEAAIPLKAAEPSEYKLRISLPVDLREKLVKRLEEQPGSQIVSDLYPGSSLPNTGDPIFQGHDEIEATWSRLRNTLGLYLRNRGYNTLHAALLSGDLGLIPRSKLYYASVSAKELHTEEHKLYRLLDLGDVVDLPAGTIGIGCRTVPTASILTLHDKALVAAVEAQRPGKNAGPQRLYTFHNKFTLLCAWRLSVLLALRATQAIDLDASIREGSDYWVAIHDKLTPEDKGLQPVPLCSYAADLIRLYKTHCAAMHLRIDGMPRASRDFSAWCSSVARSNNQRLLGCVQKNGVVTPVSSSEFTSSVSEQYELPDDVGRKVMENMLRNESTKSSHIDSVLRHFSMGQIRSSGFNTESLNSFVKRTVHAQDRIASKLFGSQVIGLKR